MRWIMQRVRNATGAEAAVLAAEARLAEQAERHAAGAREQAGNHQMELLKNQIRVQWRILDQVHAMSPSPATLKCDICGFVGPTASLRELTSHCMFGGGRLLRHQCPSCDTIFGPRKMMDLTPEELSQEYEMHYRVYPEGDSTDSELRAFHALQPVREGRYLNYGAGAWSRSVEQLRREGWDVLAYEPHEAAARGEHVITSEAHLATIAFDGIFSNNVLEHFRDPVAALRRMTSLLKPGARMSHATPCFDYLYEFTRFHLFFFPGRSLEALAKAADLKVEQFTVDGHYMNAVLGRAAEARPAG
jgi:SAM-dependent methyltransferase